MSIDYYANAYLLLLVLIGSISFARTLAPTLILKHFLLITLVRLLMERGLHHQLMGPLWGQLQIPGHFLL